MNISGAQIISEVYIINSTGRLDLSACLNTGIFADKQDRCHKHLIRGSAPITCIMTPSLNISINAKILAGLDSDMGEIHNCKLS